MNVRQRQGLMALSGVVTLLFALAASPYVSAAQSNSTNYSVDQVFMGSGGELNACSGQYCAKQSAGEVAAGNTAATAFQAQAGFNVDREPYIAFSVAGSATDLGYLSKFTTATTQATFAVKTYLASGYVVQLASDPPTNTENGHTLSTPSSPVSSAVGTEQFGINLRQNTTGCGAPANFGADPVQMPDSTFSFGVAASNYNTCGLFKYTKGDTVAASTKSSGETDYTMSFIYNISDVTPNGEYIYNGTLVATSTY
jgi:hypothetical protein